MPKQKLTLLDSDTIPSESRNGLLKNFLPWAIAVLAIAVAGTAFLMQQKHTKDLQKQISELKQNPQKITEEETKSLLDKVGQLIELPAEQPTIATVSDLAPLKDQPFFAHAEIGDKVLIFSQAQKAVLYRPSTNKVIEIAPVNLNNDQSTSTANKNINTSTDTSANSNTIKSSKNSNK